MKIIIFFTAITYCQLTCSLCYADTVTDTEKKQVVEIVDDSEHQELSYEDKARQALKNMTNEQIQKITKAANSTDSANEDNIEGSVLSIHIKTFSDIPKSIDQDIEKLKEETKILIRHIATDIEINNGTSGSLKMNKNGSVVYIPNKDLPRNLQEKKEKLLRANVQNSVSVRSATLAIQLLSQINNEIRQSASKSNNKNELEKIYMRQAVYVYEMADITLNILNEISLEGKSAIYDLYEEAKKKVKKRNFEIDKQIKRAKKVLDNEPDNFDAYEQSLLLMKDANEKSLDVWDDVISKLGNQQEFIDNLKKKKDLIELKRDTAKLQIDTLRDIQQVAGIRDLIGSLDELVNIVSDLDLLILDDATVRALLGYGIDR